VFAALWRHLHDLDVAEAQQLIDSVLKWHQHLTDLCFRARNGVLYRYLIEDREDPPFFLVDFHTVQLVLEYITVMGQKNINVDSPALLMKKGQMSQLGKFLLGMVLLLALILVLFVLKGKIFEIVAKIKEVLG